MYKLHVEREIACSHQLHGHDGKCKNLHGHNYYIVVDVFNDKLLDMGSSDGMLLDFGDIKGIIDALDHHHLNSYFENLKGFLKDGSLKDLVSVMSIQPTSERLAEFIVRTIEKTARDKYDESLKNVIVKVYESKNNYAEYSLY